MVSLNIYKNSANKFIRKNGFQNWKWNWRSRPINPKVNSNLNPGILHLLPKFGDPSLNRWWVIVPRSSKWGNFWLWSLIWPWRSRSITPQNNRDLNQGLLHLWSKFGDPSLNGWRVIARTSKWLPHTRTDGHTDRRRQRQYPKAKTGLG